MAELLTVGIAAGIPSKAFSAPSCIGRSWQDLLDRELS